MTLNHFLYFWWRSLLLFGKVGVIFWFIALTLAPVYEFIRPWPQAREAMREEGITGVPLFIGGGSNAECRRGSEEYRHEEVQRSYVLIPESFRRFEIFTYSEATGSDFPGMQKEIIRSPALIPLFVLWILAGAFTQWQIRRWIKKKELNSIE